MPPAYLLPRALGVLRGLGWFALLPFLVYAPFAAVRSAGWRSLQTYVAFLTWLVAIGAAYRLAGDQWDNPRARTVFLAAQAAIAGWAWFQARQSRSPWLRRVAVVVGVSTLVFLQWYAGRYYQTPRLNLYSTVGRDSRIHSVLSGWGDLVGSPPLDGRSARGIIQRLNFGVVGGARHANSGGATGGGCMPKALITGITGQDGSYLAEFLISKGYEVHGLIRKSSTFNTERIDHIYRDPHDPEAVLSLYYGDLSNSEQLTNLIYNVRPDEIYHMGAQSHVQVSFDMPEYTGEITGLGTTRILSAVKRSGIQTRFYQASSSEMFGDSPPPQSEDSPLRPRSPYAIAKVYAYWMATNYREAYDMFTVNGILFNHESPRRNETFLSRKVTRAVARIKAGLQEKVYLGNLESRRDYGYTPEYVQVMWKMLQQERPGDYVIGTGVAPTIGEFVKEAFAYGDLDWKEYVEIDERYFRPTEVRLLACRRLEGERRVGLGSQDHLQAASADYGGRRHASGRHGTDRRWAADFGRKLRRLASLGDERNRGAQWHGQWHRVNRS